MSVIGTSMTTCRMTLRSTTRSGEPERACENFSHGNQVPNTTDSGMRHVHLEEVNRALACEETSGLNNIYEMPELRHDLKKCYKDRKSSDQSASEHTSHGRVRDTTS